MKSKLFPMVSVVIPSYNGSLVIDRALQGVLKQTYRDYEIIVVDDGSTDSTLEVLDRYKTKIRLITQENRGCMAARQNAVEHARGDYIAFLDQDDWWIPEKLSIQVEVLRKHPKVGLTFGNLEAVDEKGNSLSFMVNPPQFCHSPSFEELLLIFPVYPSSTLLRKDLIQQIGGFDFRFGLSGAYGDQDFHLRLREVTEFFFTDKCLGYYNWNEDSPGRVQKFLTNLPIFAEKYWNHDYLLSRRGDPVCQKFVQACAEGTIYLFRGLLHQNGNKATFQLLDHINQYHQRLKGVFGYEYLRSTGLDSLDLSIFPLDSTLATLLFIYLCRSGLQEMFPEVSEGKITNFLNWALKVSNGTYVDVDNAVLQPYEAYIKQRLQTTATVVTKQSLAASFEGRGIEIGALNGPIAVPKASEIIYVDHLDFEELKQSYPEHANIFKPHLLSDACKLAIRDSSLDFIITSHVLEHLTNPLAALQEFYRCLKSGGQLMLVIPDKRFTFDKDRGSTTIRHLVQDYNATVDEVTLDRQHVEEWVEKIDNFTPTTPPFKAKVSHLLLNRSGIHKHVWTDSDFMTLLEYIIKFHLPFALVEFIRATPQSKEFVCILRKNHSIHQGKSFENLAQEPDFIVEGFDLISQLRRRLEFSADLLKEQRSDLLVLSAIKRSFIYRIIRSWSSFTDKLLPDGTKRANLKRLFTVSFHIIAQEGFITWFKLAYNKVKRRDFTIRHNL